MTITVEVRNNNVEKALRVLKKKLQKALNREPAENEIIIEMYMTKNPKNKEKLVKKINKK